MMKCWSPGRSTLGLLWRWAPLWIVLGTLSSGDDLRATMRVYVSVAGQEAVALLEMNETTGQLAARGSWPLAGEPGALAISPDGQTLFVALRSTGRLMSCRVDRKTGQLAPLDEVAAGDDPAQLGVAPDGRHLLTAYYVAGKVTVHAVSVSANSAESGGVRGARQHGALSAQAAQELPTADKAHAIVFDPSGQFAYAPHTGRNQVFQFRWHAESQRLSPLEPSVLQRPTQTGPRHLAWHPRAAIAYINNEQGSSVTAYRRNEQGQLTPGETAATLPPEFRGDNATAEIKVHPSGRWLYVSNRGHDSIARVSLDREGTELAWAECTPTEATPRSFDLTPDGRYLLAAGEGSGAVSVYAVDQVTGKLQPVARHTIGPRLWWVLCVDSTAGEVRHEKTPSLNDSPP